MNLCIFDIVKNDTGTEPFIEYEKSSIRRLFLLKVSLHSMKCLDRGGTRRRTIGLQTKGEISDIQVFD